AANWRITYLIGAIPLLYAVLLFFLMRETPHWYANAGRREEAVKRIQEIQRTAGKPVTDLDPSLLKIPPKPVKSHPGVLFTRKYVMVTCGLFTAYFIGQFCIFGMNAWIPAWFRVIGYTAEQATNLQTFNNVAAILSNISVGFVSDIVGRKRNLAFGWLFSIVAIVVCSTFVVPSNYVLCIALMLLFGFALNYTITAVQPMMAESYPTQIRNTGVSWCQAFARFGGALAPIILGGLATSAAFQGPNPATGAIGTNWGLLVLVLVIPLALAFVLTLVFFRRETKGKSLDVIAEEIEN
ncbi:MAG: MFS transporter, partial [Coriobacteriales bacterium]|nr:MFS transporter [Coriobacteriales bacterium]